MHLLDLKKKYLRLELTTFLFTIWLFFYCFLCNVRVIYLKLNKAKDENIYRVGASLLYHDTCPAQDLETNFGNLVTRF